MEKPERSTSMSVAEEVGARIGHGRVTVVLALLGIALGFRLCGIAAEPFWHDEAISFDVSRGSIAEVIQRNARDVRPPLYYIGLDLWRRVFKDSDARIRAYSTAWSLIGLLALFVLARDLGGWRAGLIALLLAAVNPQDIYFAQEARNYAQTAALCTLGSWCLWRWMTAASTPPRLRDWRRWAICYTLCSIAALYTHNLSVLVLVAQGIFALIWFGWRRHWTSIAGYAACTLLVTLGFLPWFFLLKRARGSPALGWPEWIPVPLPSDYFSFLGREFFWGQVRTVHEHWWPLTMVLPVLVLCLCLRRAYTSRSAGLSRSGESLLARTLYPVWLLVGPVLLIAIAVRVYHPIYFRQRFSMLVLPPFLVLAAIACNSLGTRAATWLAATMLGVVMLTGTCIQHHTYQKVYWNDFVKVWQAQGPPAHMIFFPRQLERTACYYLKQPVYSAEKREIRGRLPQLKGKQLWVGSMIGYGYDKWEGEFDYFQWLLRLGRVRHVYLRTGFYLRIVTVGEPSIHDTRGDRLDRWYWPSDIPRRIEGFDKSEQFYILEHDGPEQSPFRWSLPKAWFSLGDKDDITTVILNVSLPPPVPAGYRPELRFYAKRGKSASDLFDSKPALVIADYCADPFEIGFAAPQGRGRLWIGWRMAGVNLLRAGVSSDGRDLGLRINWAGVINHPNKE